MAIPKTLKAIDYDKAMAIITKNLKTGNGYWEGAQMFSDFIYKAGSKHKMIRPGFSEKTWETGIVSM